MGQGQKAPVLVQLPLFRTAQGDGETVLLGPVHVVAIRADLLLESTVSGGVLRLGRKGEGREYPGEPRGVTSPEAAERLGTGDHLSYRLPCGSKRSVLQMHVCSYT